MLLFLLTIRTSVILVSLCIFQSKMSVCLSVSQSCLLPIGNHTSWSLFISAKMSQTFLICKAKTILEFCLEMKIQNGFLFLTDFCILFRIAKFILLCG